MSSPARSATAIAAFLPGSLAPPSAPTLTSATRRPRNSSVASPRRPSNEFGSSLNVLPRHRVKDTRAAVVGETAGSTYIHPAALFALSQAEIAHHSEAPRDYSWGYGDTDDVSDETTQEADGASGAENDSLEPEPDADFDNLNSDENAHLHDRDLPIVQKRTRAASATRRWPSRGTIRPHGQKRGHPTRRPRALRSFCP